MRGAVDVVFVLTVIALAVPVAMRLSRRERTILVAWLALLGVLAGAGVFLHTEPPTTIVATLPYIWLPGFLVPLALTLRAASLITLVGPASPKEKL